MFALFLVVSYINNHRLKVFIKEHINRLRSLSKVNFLQTFVRGLSVGINASASFELIQWSSGCTRTWKQNVGKFSCITSALALSGQGSILRISTRLADLSLCLASGKSLSQLVMITAWGLAFLRGKKIRILQNSCTNKIGTRVLSTKADIDLSLISVLKSAIKLAVSTRRSSPISE